MPESEKVPKVKLRLSFDLSNKRDIDQWMNDLRQNGVVIIGKTATGLDIEGTKEQLQEVLAIDITIDGDNIRIRDSVPSKSLKTERRPRMYSPRRPTLF